MHRSEADAGGIKLPDPVPVVGNFDQERRPGRINADPDLGVVAAAVPVSIRQGLEGDLIGRRFYLGRQRGQVNGRGNVGLPVSWLFAYGEPPPCRLHCCDEPELVEVSRPQASGQATYFPEAGAHSLPALPPPSCPPAPLAP